MLHDVTTSGGRFLNLLLSLQYLIVIRLEKEELLFFYNMGNKYVNTLRQ
jgi:hypothetical protein